MRSLRNRTPLHFRVGYTPGVIGAVVRLQADYYSRVWGFGQAFEAHCASGLGAFLQRYDRDRDRLLTAWDDGRCVGAAAVDGSDADPGHAELRWVIVHPHYHGQGLGARLMADVMDFCRASGVRRLSLHTFAGLDAARRLYERHGFRLVREEPGFTGFGPEVTVQFFDCDLPAGAAAPR